MARHPSRAGRERRRVAPDARLDPRARDVHAILVVDVDALRRADPDVELAEARRRGVQRRKPDDELTRSGTAGGVADVGRDQASVRQEAAAVGIRGVGNALRSRLALEGRGEPADALSVKGKLIHALIETEQLGEAAREFEALNQESMRRLREIQRTRLTLAKELAFANRDRGDFAPVLKYAQAAFDLADVPSYFPRSEGVRDFLAQEQASVAPLIVAQLERGGKIKEAEKLRAAELVKQFKAEMGLISPEPSTGAVQKTIGGKEGQRTA